MAGSVRVIIVILQRYILQCLHVNIICHDSVGFLFNIVINNAVVSHRLPTMLIAECVLVYIEPNLSSQLIKWAGKLFPTALFLNYEPVSDLFLTSWVEML